MLILILRTRGAAPVRSQVRARALELASVYHALSSIRPSTRAHSPSVARVSVKLSVNYTVIGGTIHNRTVFKQYLLFQL